MPRCSPPARAPTAIEALDRGEARRRVLRRATAGPPRDAVDGDGLLPPQQRGGRGGRAGRARRARPDRRLRRAPRQRHAGHRSGRIPASPTSRCTSTRSTRARATGTRSAGAPARGLTVNVPLAARAPPATRTARPSSSSSRRSRRSFEPTWVLLSAGFDAHRADPLTDSGLSAGDFADLTDRARSPSPPPGRRLVFLEGGYDLDALAASAPAPAWRPWRATVRAPRGRPRRGGPGTGRGPRRGPRCGPRPSARRLNRRSTGEMAGPQSASKPEFWRIRVVRDPGSTQDCNDVLGFSPHVSAYISFTLGDYGRSLHASSIDFDPNRLGGPGRRTRSRTRRSGARRRAPLPELAGGARPHRRHCVAAGPYAAAADASLLTLDLPSLSPALLPQTNVDLARSQANAESDADVDADKAGRAAHRRHRRHHRHHLGPRRADRAAGERGLGAGVRGERGHPHPARPVAAPRPAGDPHHGAGQLGQRHRVRRRRHAAVATPTRRSPTSRCSASPQGSRSSSSTPMTPTAPPTPRRPPTSPRSPVTTTPAPSRPGSITDITSANVLNDLAPDLALGDPDRRRADAELRRERHAASPAAPRSPVTIRSSTSRIGGDPIITLDSANETHRGGPHRPGPRRPPRPRRDTGFLADLLDDLGLGALHPGRRRRSTDAVATALDRAAAHRPAVDPGREGRQPERHHRQRPGLAPAGRAAPAGRPRRRRAARRRCSTRSSAPSAPTSAARCCPSTSARSAPRSSPRPVASPVASRPTRCVSSTSTPRPPRSLLVAPSSTTSPSRTVARAWSGTSTVTDVVTGPAGFEIIGTEPDGHRQRRQRHLRPR